MKTIYQRMYLVVCLLFAAGSLLAQQQTLENNGICRDPISGTAVTVNAARSQAVSNGANVTDADLSNFATLGGSLVTILGSRISLRDQAQYYPGGNVAGFVVEPVGGLLSASLLNGGIRLSTYRNGQLVEQSTTSGAGALSASLLAGSSGRQLISFATTQPFDEIQLEVLQALGLISTLRVYYAYEGPSSCPTDCVQPLTTGVTSDSGNVSSGGIGVCAVGVNNLDNLTDASLTTFATLAITGVSIGGTCGVYAEVRSSTTIPASVSSPEDVGFAIGSGAGLLDVDLLSRLTISTYSDNTLLQSISGNNLLRGDLIGGTEATLVSFKATQPFNRVRLTINSTVAIGADTRVYYAFTRSDTDNDGVPDCLDKCTGGDGTLDTDSDGIPDGCDQNIADVRVTVTAGSTTTASVGSVVSFTITATKNGNINELYASPTGLVISNTLTTGLSSVSFTAPTGTLYDPGTGSWTIGSALSGTAVQALSLVISAQVDSVGVLSNTAKITRIDQSNASSITGGSACVSVPITGCEGDVTEISAPDGYTGYQWFRNNVPITGATGQTYEASTSGSYSYTAIASGSPTGTLNCPAGNCCPVILELTPIPTVTAGQDVTICSGTQTTLTASTTLSNGVSYRWSTGDVTASIQVNPNITTTFTVTAVVGNAVCFTVDTVVVNVNRGPATAGGVARCTSDGFYAITLNPSGGTGQTYTVTLNGQPVSGTFTYGVETQPLGNFAVSSGGSVAVVLTDSQTGCSLETTIAGPAPEACTCTTVCAPLVVKRTTKR
ncbi:DUF11 domain-containing protein [Fibrisoma montanum]|uniref:DUF11 domain-containing protein n=1 Tax=Fibrisoma montanum TaxID=2305895 RepID=A0A418MAQ2_9BACT|nr:DUF11 domain-containing protein [Fibrisoma montanum]RIV23429.1 DUF11 domain-containing protein [Fibrisoma montanum]